MTGLNAQIIAAHAQGDQSRLVTLYTQAADQQADLDAACFFLTNAYILALELGDARTATLYQRLAAHGRV